MIKMKSQKFTILISKLINFANDEDALPSLSLSPFLPGEPIKHMLVLS